MASVRPGGRLFPRELEEWEQARLPFSTRSRGQGPGRHLRTFRSSGGVRDRWFAVLWRQRRAVRLARRGRRAIRTRWGWGQAFLRSERRRRESRGPFDRRGFRGGRVQHFHGDVQGAQDETGTLGVEGVADESIEDFHERGLDGVLVFDDGDGMQARKRRAAHAAMGLLVKVAELLSAQRSCAATDAGDLDMSTSF